MVFTITVAVILHINSCVQLVSCLVNPITEEVCGKPENVVRAAEKTSMKNVLYEPGRYLYSCIII